MELLSFGDMHVSEPPAWLKEAPQGERSSFETALGEQWVAEAGDEALRLTGGQVGWRTLSIAVPDYRRLVATLSDASVAVPFGGTEVTLSPAERDWLCAVCLSRVE